MKRKSYAFIGLAALLALAFFLVIGTRKLPPLDGRTVSRAAADTDDTRLGRATRAVAAPHPGLSGVVPLAEGRDALAARVLLADAAERTLDVQYYIWQRDLSGTLLLEAVWRAADRGVRVRLLLDDNNTGGLDRLLATFSAHPNIEVRLFNPFFVRRWRALGYLTDFSRLNRRMHNKSFTVDNQVTIIGGRNVGDEYFGAGQEMLFVDLDVLAIGPVVREVSDDFDRYWSSESAHPVERILRAVTPLPAGELHAWVLSARADERAQAYVDALSRQPFVHRLLAGQLEFEWTEVQMLSDDPAKALGRTGPVDGLSGQFGPALAAARREVQLVSPYFVPTAAGADRLRKLAASGVRISVLTNALEATDVLPAHAGYAKHRRVLLDAGIQLFELRRHWASPDLKERGLAGSSGASLHAKTFAVDRSRIFIGSFNFDPRSARLNTEMGFLIDSPALAQRLAFLFEEVIPMRSYEVELAADGSLQWREHRAGEWFVHADEPGGSTLRQAAIWILERLPIDWLL